MRNSRRDARCLTGNCISGEVEHGPIMVLHVSPSPFDHHCQVGGRPCNFAAWSLLNSNVTGRRLIRLARKVGTTRRCCDPLPSWVKNRSRHHQCQAEAHPWVTLPHFRHWLYPVPKRIVCTIGSETSTTTRHRDANTLAARWSRRASVPSRRK